MDLQTLVSMLEKKMAAQGSGVTADKMQQYMRNQFQFFGLPKPERQALTKAFWNNNVFPTGENLRILVDLLWEHPCREMQYHALDLLVHQKQQLDLTWIPFLLDLGRRKSWWDTIDIIAPNLIGAILLRYPDQIDYYSHLWIRDQNIWIQRIALLFQLKYKEKTKAETLLVTISYRAASKEFFVQKAAGWALRTYAKIDAEVVADFIRENNEKLSALTIREGSKYLNKSK